MKLLLSCGKTDISFRDKNGLTLVDLAELDISEGDKKTVADQGVPLGSDYDSVPLSISCSRSHLSRVIQCFVSWQSCLKYNRRINAFVPPQ